MKPSLNDGPQNWMARAADDASTEMVDKFAALFAAFYNGLRSSGLSETAAVLLTQTYIAATVAATTRASQAQGGAA